MSRAGWTQLTPVQTLYLAGIILFAGDYVVARGHAWTLVRPGARYYVELQVLGRTLTVALVASAVALMVLAAWMHDRGRGVAVPDVLPASGRWLAVLLVTLGSLLPLFLPALLPPVRGVGAEAFASLGSPAFALCLLQMTPAFILLSWLQSRTTREAERREG